MKSLRLSLIAFTVLFSTASHADSLDKLKNFISGTQTMRASFEQSVTDKNGKKLQAASGTTYAVAALVNHADAARATPALDRVIEWLAARA